MRRFGLLAIAAVCAAISIGTAAKARELTFAIGLPPIHDWAHAYKYMEEHLEERTNGTLTAKVYYGSLLNLKQALTGIRDGIADVGFLVPGYHPAEFPETNLIIDLAMLGKDTVAMSAATSEYLFTCPECMQENKDQGTVFLGMSSNPPYMILSKEPLTTPASLKGKKLRSFSAFGRWAEYVGGIKVSMSANDIYEALSQGVLDANLHAASQLYTLNFADVVSYVTRLPLGTYQGNSLFNVNTNVWRDLTTEERQAMIDLAAEANAYSSVKAAEFNRHVLDKKAPADGIQVLDPDPALVKMTEEFVRKDLAGIADLARKNYGIENPEEKIERFRALIAKWEGLLDGMERSDHEKVAALFKREIYDKLDAASFGM